MTDVITVAIRQPYIISWVSILAVGVHRIRSPVEASDCVLLRLATPGRFAVPQFGGRMPGGMAVPRDEVHRLLIDRRDAPLIELVVLEFIVAPCEYPTRLLFPVRIPIWMLQNVKCHRVRVYFCI